MTIASILLTRHAPIVGAALLASSVSALAAPVASGPAIDGSGDGLNSTWVYTDTTAAHTIADAEAVLAASPADSTVHVVVPYIDFTDGYVDPEEHFVGTTLEDPFTGTVSGNEDPRYSVRFSGFLNVTSPGTYSFLARTDDGFRLVIGDETISLFDSDRGPADTVSDPVALEAGLYSIEMIGWEQGGVFAFELGWGQQGEPETTITYELIPQSALFTAQPVPLPPALPLAAAGFAALATRRRRAARG